MKDGPTIYLDHQATTPVDRQVYAAMVPFYTNCFANPHSSDHVLGWEAAEAVEAAKLSVAGLVGAEADETIFTSGATESNNLALLGLARGASGRVRRRVLVSAIEHESVLAIGRALQEHCNIEVQHISVDREGLIDLNHLENLIGDDVLAVSVMVVNNEIGTIQDVAAVSQVVRRYGAVLHCDAAQAPVAMDLRPLGSLIDMFSLSAHKMYGPKGVGAAVIRRELHGFIEPLFYGGGQQAGLRSGTIPVPLCVGMGRAAELLLSDGEVQRAKLRDRTDRFVRALQTGSFQCTPNGPPIERRHPGNANLRIPGFDAHDVLGALQPRIAASTGSACSSGIPGPSHVLRAVGMSAEEAEESIRFSLGYGTSEAEINEAVGLIEEALSTLASG